MEISIKGDVKEIAALVVAIQERQVSEIDITEIVPFWRDDPEKLMRYKMLCQNNREHASRRKAKQNG